MQEHLVEGKGTMSAGLSRRRSSLRDSLLAASGGAAAGRRVSRDNSFSGRSLLSSFAASDAGGGVSLSSLGVEVCECVYVCVYLCVCVSV